MGKAYYVPGVGVDLSRFKSQYNDGSNIRTELGLDDKDILVVVVGRLDRNKNNITIIKAISLTKNKNVHLVICGDGEQKDEILNLSKKLGVFDKIHLLGNRNDIPQIFSRSDIFVLASFREGLSRSIMEAMAAGLPCIVSDIRGNRDLIDIGKGGYLFPSKNFKCLAEALNRLSMDETLRNEMGNFNKLKVDQFSIKVSQEAFYSIFSSELKNN